MIFWILAVLVVIAVAYTIYILTTGQTYEFHIPEGSIANSFEVKP
jgi:hypothetical protein